MHLQKYVEYIIFFFIYFFFACHISFITTCDVTHIEILKNFFFAFCTWRIYLILVFILCWNFIFYYLYNNILLIIFFGIFNFYSSKWWDPFLLGVKTRKKKHKNMDSLERFRWSHEWNVKLEQSEIKMRIFFHSRVQWDVEKRGWLWCVVNFKINGVGVVWKGCNKFIKDCLLLLLLFYNIL